MLASAAAERRPLMNAVRLFPEYNISMLQICISLLKGQLTNKNNVHSTLYCIVFVSFMLISVSDLHTYGKCRSCE